MGKRAYHMTPAGLAARQAAIRKRWATPGAIEGQRYAMLRAHAVRRAKAQMAARREGIEPPAPALPAIDVPSWVERAELVDDFTDVARAQDEFAAAAHCRRLLAEARA